MPAERLQNDRVFRKPKSYHRLFATCRRTQRHKGKGKREKQDIQGKQGGQDRNAAFKKKRRSLRKNPVEAMGGNALEETAAPVSHLMTNEHKHTGGRIEGREPISYIPPGPRIMPRKRHRMGCWSGGLQLGSCRRACCRTRCR